MVMMNYLASSTNLAAMATKGHTATQLAGNMGILKKD